jgi:hypothetical protein
MGCILVVTRTNDSIIDAGGAALQGWYVAHELFQPVKERAQAGAGAPAFLVNPGLLA